MKDFCRHCGRELDGTENNCPECGKPLRVSNNPQQMQKKKGADLFQIAFLLIALILVFNLLMPSFIPVVPTNEYKLHYDWDCYEKHFSCDFEITKDSYNKAVTSPIDRDGTVSSVHYQITDSEGKVIKEVFAVSEYIVVDDDIKKLAETLKNLWKENYEGKEGDPELAQFYAWFCQTALDYKEDKASKGSEEFWKYPIETLHDGGGDCEDTAILLAALLQASGEYDEQAGIFLITGHAMGAINTEAVDKEYETSHFEYYPIETATRIHTINLVDIGVVDEKHEHSYFHLYTGYSDTYYQKSE